ncbi:MAG: branched-chain amino acid ABC transporter permease [Promethearchaeota archaeon]
MSIISILVFGAALGCVLALLSVGYSLVYGVGGIINLSHGAYYILTAYIIFWLIDFRVVTYPIAIIIGLSLIALLGIFTYLALIKPIQHNEIGVMIVTFALAFLIEQAILVYEGSKPEEIKDIALIPFAAGQINIFGTMIDAQYVVIMIAAVVILSALILFIKKSKLGKSIRAVSQDHDAARLMGINVNLILMFVLTLSAVLAGIAAILYVSVTPIYPNDGWDYLLLSMSVVILGGLGSLPGSVIGAFIISFSRFIFFYWVDIPYNVAYSGIIHLAVIVVMLIFRPRGILGKKERT